MLRILRKKGVAKKILWVLAVIITISFVFWGISSSLTSSKSSISYAGKIFGRTVSFLEYKNSIEHVKNQAILRYGENFYKIQNQINMNAEAWDRLILLHEGKKRRVNVSNEEVIAVVKKFPFFQRNDKFDNQLYQQSVEYIFHCTPRDFEEGVRESLIFEKIFKEETAKVVVTDEDVLRQYNMENGKVQVDYIVFPFRDHENGVVIKDTDIKQYYEKNKDAFQLPFSVNINYVSLEYPLNASEDAKTKLGDSAQNMANDMVKNKLTLKQLGENHQMPLKETGFFSAEEPNMSLGWPWELFQKALSLKKGENPSVFKTEKGFYFLELKDTQEPRLLSFDEAKDKAKAALMTSQAKKLAELKAQEALQQIQQEFTKNPNESFETITKTFGLKVEKTPEFNMAQYLPGVGPSPQFHQTAFSLTKEKPLSGLTEIANGYAILYLNNLIEANKETFEKDKETLKESLLAKRRDQIFNDFLAQLRQKAKLVDNMKKLEEQATRGN